MMETLKNSTPKNMTSNNRRRYNQTIITYDTESTSLFKYKDAPDTWRPYIDGKSDDLIDAAAVTWAHMWCIDGHFFMARTMDEAREVFRQIGAADPDVYKIVWVHNLKYDFAAAILNIFDDLEVFARTARDVMIARSDEYKIEFRCSYKLLNTSLGNAAKTLKIETQKGDLDYTLFRSPDTPLTNEEIDYCRRDVVALWEIMKVYKKEYKRVEKIPHTSTGIIRKDVQHKCDPLLYKRTAAALPDTVQKFLLQTSAFYGGYTHANAARVNEYIQNVFQYDLASAYPAAMLFEDYPAGDMWNMPPELWEKQKDEPGFLWIGRFVFTEVEAVGFNSFLSFSRLWNKGIGSDSDAVPYGLDNGRLRSAPIVDTFFTSVDYEIFAKNYTFTSVRCIEWCQGRRGKLENSFRRYVLSLYEKKTTLKGGGDEYRRAKNNINGLYG